ncbi:unnamed protein product [Diamesa serratosioi]
MNNLFKPTFAEKASQQKSSMRKSIQRNVDVPLKQPEVRRTIAFLKENKQNVPVLEKKISTVNYDEPRENRLKELRKKLDEVKSYEAQAVRTLQDLSQNSQEMVLKQVSSKLNFPSNQAIYKNLPKLYDDKRNIEATKVVQKTARQIKDLTRYNKTLSIKEDINSLLNELVDLEYQEQDENLMKTTQMLELPTENEFLGLNKFTAGEPNIYLPNKRSETQRFLDFNAKNMFEDYFISDNYLKSSICNHIKERANDTVDDHGCTCIKQIYESKLKS